MFNFCYWFLILCCVSNANLDLTVSIIAMLFVDKITNIYYDAIKTCFVFCDKFLINLSFASKFSYVASLLSSEIFVECF